ncbi:hypothetical protein L228DRAFT_18015 [Xylona heveae TC161]|uniref:Uncharacterized protein n=1 Tax=Xylona heveae (strain CBS 132557 / TC161) TaxID=1328760 RepID=A0A165JXH6_XYLHT|nr:hypothetical protein L228DRAFT_18015 [Xylona heveae TC161]KZF26748.1 hypothetical protein L228DRAFT_18015 [Xylona heveae TC161]
MEDGAIRVLDAETVVQPQLDQKKTLGDVSKANGRAKLGHKRSLSGSILSKLSFLRNGQEEDDTQEEEKLEGTQDGVGRDLGEADHINKPRGAMAGVVQQQRSRRRKGSLRKTALLGTGKLHLDNEDRRRGETAVKASARQMPSEFPADFHSSQSLQGPMSDSKRMDAHSSQGSEIRLVDEPASDNLGQRTAYAIGYPGSSEITKINTSAQNASHALGSPVTSPTLSTTDDDEVLTFPHRYVTPSALRRPSSGSDSYFSSQPSALQRRRSGNKSKAAALVPDPSSSLEEWDYTETERWGWIVLVVTWIVFVVGMGSCLGVWSWAWDVGETPYAPPELEDDPTLPVVGYYPALIILTAVMAWVWVVVAWVGMKYFKHAQISGEDV